MPKINHVFLDLDHTLWDFDQNSRLTFEKILKLNNVKVDLDSFLSFYEPINLKYWKLYREERITKDALRYGRLKDAFDALNFQIEDKIITTLSENYIEYLATFDLLFEGTIDILDYLSKTYQLHIITNGFEEVQDKKLVNSNIKHYFKTVTNSEMVGVKKPNPKIFNFALQLANAKVEESIMIGDSLEADIQGADAIGLDTILFDYKVQHNNTGFKTVNKLKDIKNYL